jgi:hypothetical protein
VNIVATGTLQDGLMRPMYMNQHETCPMINATTQHFPYRLQMAPHMSGGVMNSPTMNFRGLAPPGHYERHHAVSRKNSANYFSAASPFKE